MASSFQEKIECSENWAEAKGKNKFESSARFSRYVYTYVCVFVAEMTFDSLANIDSMLDRLRQSCPFISIIIVKVLHTSCFTSLFRPFP